MTHDIRVSHNRNAVKLLVYGVFAQGMLLDTMLWLAVGSQKFQRASFGLSNAIFCSDSAQPTRSREHLLVHGNGYQDKTMCRLPTGSYVLERHLFDSLEDFRSCFKESSGCPILGSSLGTEDVFQ